MRAALLLLLFLTLNLSAAFGQSVLSGIVIDSVSGNPIQYVNIQNRSQKRAVQSTFSGHFRITATDGDTLVVSHVGYKTRSLVRAGGSTSLLIRMVQEVQLLKEVQVTGWTERRFKEEFMKMSAPTTAKMSIALPPMGVSLGEAGRMGYDYKDLSPKLTLKGPVSVMYDKFSKDAKNQRKYNEMHRREQNRQRYQLKMDTLWIARVTDLKGKELHSFIAFCKLPESLVLSADEYELAVAIRGCLKDFLAMNRKEEEE